MCFFVLLYLHVVLFFFFFYKGKSSLLKTVAEGNFPEDGELPSIEEALECSIQVQGIPVTLHLQDTMGQEAFRKITQSFYQGCQAIVICYDVSDRDSFTNLPQWMDEIDNYMKLQKKNTYIPLILVGNKCDLVENKNVSSNEGEEFAKSRNMAFFETSALQGVNLKDPFECIVECLANPPVAQTAKSVDQLKLRDGVELVSSKKSRSCILL